MKRDTGQANNVTEVQREPIAGTRGAQRGVIDMNDMKVTGVITWTAAADALKTETAVQPAVLVP